MQVTLNPVLTDLERIRLGSWLIATLSSEKLDNNISFPLDGCINIFQDHVPYRLNSGVWQQAGYAHQLFLARPGTEISLRERLSILLVLSQLCKQSVELVSACSGAITRYLLGEHRELSSSLVSASVPVSGLAFSSDRIASLLDGVWMLPSGETVDVSGPEWTVCATEVPAAPVVDVAFNAGPFGPAFSPFDDGSASSAPVTEFRRPVPGELPALTTPQFTVGQRVHWTPEEQSVEYEAGDGVIISDRSVAGYYRLRMDDGRTSEPLATIEELSALPVEFVVGQRVHWTPSGEDAAAAIQECDGVLQTVFADPTEEEGYTHSLRADDGQIWHARAEDLRAL